MNVHHRRALAVIGVVCLIDLASGVAYGLLERVGELHGIYCATGMADTEGCDVAPSGAAGYWLALGMQLSMIPLCAAVISLVTTGLTADHIDDRHDKQLEGKRADGTS